MRFRLWHSCRSLAGCVARKCRLLCVGLALSCSLIAVPDAAAVEPLELARVRVDLRADGFLDPLPFDQPFVITGTVPESVSEVELSFTELYGKGYSLASRPDVVAVFGETARAFLDSVLVPATRVTPGRVKWLRERLRSLLEDAAPLPPKFGPSAVSNVLPWNWGNLTTIWRKQAPRLVDTSGLFDATVSAPSSVNAFRERVEALAAADGGLDRAIQLDALVEHVVEAARSGRVAPGPIVQEIPSVVRWRRFGKRLSVRDDVRGPDDRWNRLAQRLEDSGASSDDEVTSFQLIAPELRADRVYLVRTTLHRMVTEQEAGQIAVDTRVDMARTTVLHREISVAIDRTLDGYVPAEGNLSVSAHNADSLRQSVAMRLSGQRLTRSSSLLAGTGTNDYVSFDAGVIHVREIGETSIALGANIYLRPVAKRVPLSQHGGFLRRFSFTLGLTLQSIEDRRKTRLDLFGNQALVLGVGYRISQYLKLNAGSLVFRERNPETFPLTESTSLAGSPYVGASFDIDVGEQLKGFGRLFDFLKGGGVE